MRTLCVCLCLAAGVLAGAPAFGQSRTTPRPEENLKAYKVRMEALFAPQIAAFGVTALARKENSEYNDYLRFLRQWESRLSGPPIDGDFKAYFELESTFYRNHPAAGRPRLALRAKPAAAGAAPARLAAGTGPWQEIGPIAKPTSNVGAEGTGPIEFVTFYAAAPSRMLSGSVAGGLFYSTNGGVTWSKTGTDTEIGRSGVGTAVFHPGDYRTWFAASAGNSTSNEPLWLGLTGGVFRTADEGVTWTQIGSQAQLGGIWSQIFRLAINPADANQLWAATSTGLYVTTNALAASPVWTAVPALAGKYVYDFKVRPGDASWLYLTAADWSNGSHVNWSFMVSRDNGATWQDLPGQPASAAGAMALTLEVSPAKADNLYCLTVHPGFYPSELYIYDFGAGAWSLVYDSATISMGGGHSFGVSPFDPGEIFLSEDTEGRRYDYAGASPAPFIKYDSTYSSDGTYHPDIECLVPHPVNPNEVWMCHHGGLSVSTDRGVSWADRSIGLGAALVLRIATAASDPGYVALGLYHDGTIVTSSPWYPLWAPGWRQFQGAFCDGLLPLIDPTTPMYMWHSCQWGSWELSTDYGVTFDPDGPDSPSWIVGAAFDHLAPATQYRIGSDAFGHPTLFRTTDRFTTSAQIADFQALYPAATYQYILVAVYTPETNGDHLLVHLLERPAGSSVDWTYHLYRTTIANAASAAGVIASWQELPLPENRWISGVVFDPVDPNVVYISNSSSSNFVSSPTGKGMVFRVNYANPAASTHGACNPGVCEDLTGNLPNATTGADALAVERGGQGGLYFASDFGLSYSNRATRALGGIGWAPLGSGLPNTGYNGVQINYVNDKVRVGSAGRGAWEADLASGCVEPPPSPALWLPLDEAAGPTALNAAAPIQGAYLGAPAPVPTAAGKVAGALCFAGASAHLDVPAYSSISFAGSDFSLSAWVERGPGSGNGEVLIDKRSDTGGPVRGYSLFLVSGTIGLQLADGRYDNYLSTSAVPADGRWHHVVVTVARNDTAGGRFYLDGELAGPPFDPTHHRGSLNSSAPFRVGARSALSSVPVSGVFQGCLDEVEAFRRVLDADEVLTLYRAGANGQCKESCVLPAVTTFCGVDPMETASAELCNDLPVPQTFAYSFEPLPAQSGCAVAGPTSFLPAAATLAVPAGRCAGVPVSISRPPRLQGDGTTACYRMRVTASASPDAFFCGATMEAETSCVPRPPV